jgi:hypothetical protein
MTAHSRDGNLARDLKVIFADLNLNPPQAAGSVDNSAYLFWPRHMFDAATDARLLLNREMIDLFQRNLNASFGLLRKVVGARSFGEVIELQASHLSNQVTALIGQSEELATLSIKTATEFMRSAYPGRQCGHDLRSLRPLRSTRLA